MCLARLGVLLACAATLVTGRAVAGEESVNPGYFEPGPGIPALVKAAQNDPRGEYAPAPEPGRLRARTLARDLVATAEAGDPGLLAALAEDVVDFEPPHDRLTDVHWTAPVSCG